MDSIQYNIRTSVHVIHSIFDIFVVVDEALQVVMYNI
jgi:hypothetical protein